MPWWGWLIAGIAGGGLLVWLVCFLFFFAAISKWFEDF